MSLCCWLILLQIFHDSVSSQYGMLLCRPNGKSTRVRRNHSSANLLHNHKVFSGDMLSFIQVAFIFIIITPSHFHLALWQRQKNQTFWFSYSSLHLFLFILSGIRTADSNSCGKLHSLYQPQWWVFKMERTFSQPPPGIILCLTICLSIRSASWRDI